MSTVHPALRDAFRALDEAGVPWVLLRGADRLDAAAEVDILVAAAAMPRIAPALHPSGWILGPRPGFGTHRFLVRYLRDEQRWLTLDIVTQLAYGRRFELDTGAARDALGRRSRADGLWLLDPRDRFPTLALHHLLDRPRVSDDERRHLGQAAAEWRRAARATRAGALERWLDELVPGGTARLAAAIDDPVRWRRLRRGVRRSAVRTRPLGIALELARGLVRRRLARLPIPVRPGLAVALLGPDGSGKSTLAECLASSWPLPVRRVYLGLYPVRAPRPGPGARLAGTLGRRMPGGSGIARLLRMWRGWIRGAMHAAAGGLTIYDRHPIEAGIGGSAGRKARLLARSCPAPDLAVLLDAPAETLHARKAEHGLEVVERQRRGYLALARRRTDMRIVDGTPPLEEVEPVVSQLLWDAYRARAVPRRKP